VAVSWWTDADKRRWEKAGMSWMKRRDEADKRRWEKSGMSWMKRPAAAEAAARNDYDGYYNAYDDDDAAQESDAVKRRWEKSGLSWIKRRE